MQALNRNKINKSRVSTESDRTWMALGNRASETWSLFCALLRAAFGPRFKGNRPVVTNLSQEVTMT